MKNLKLFITLMAFGIVKSSYSQNLYFPPLFGSAWETTDPASLGWCTDNIDDLYNYLDTEESKAFIVLKDGKIVLEKYFDTFTKDSLWYWASAGKTLTAFLIGMAQQEGKLKLTDPTSKYLGAGWTSTTPQQEREITILHQLTMTSGLDDAVSDNHCTNPECLIYKTDAGNRWAYHNAPYTLLRDVLESATGTNENLYIQSHLKNRTGMTGLWITTGFDNVYISNARSMARFGLLILNKGTWDQDALMTDQSYFNAMVNTSQDINKSYGYLWWLNGKSSFMVPGLQIVLPGSYCPEAPVDMFAGIGKNGQLLCVIPSLNMVVLRMGESTGNDEVPLVLCNQMWARLNQVICGSTASQNTYQNELQVFPIPCNETLNITPIDNHSSSHIFIYNLTGELVFSEAFHQQINVSCLDRGMYFLTVQSKVLSHTIPFCKM